MERHAIKESVLKQKISRYGPGAYDTRQHLQIVSLSVVLSRREPMLFAEKLAIYGLLSSGRVRPTSLVSLTWLQLVSFPRFSPLLLRLLGTSGSERCILPCISSRTSYRL